MSATKSSQRQQSTKPFDGTANPNSFITYNSGTDSINIATSTMNDIGSYNYRMDFSVAGSNLPNAGSVYFDVSIGNTVDPSSPDHTNTCAFNNFPFTYMEGTYST